MRLEGDTRMSPRNLALTRAAPSNASRSAEIEPPLLEHCQLANCSCRASPPRARNLLLEVAELSLMKAKLILRAMTALWSVCALFQPQHAFAQSDNETTASPSPTVPAGPRPTATVTPLQSTPQPTATVTPLASASPDGTQPQTSNTVAPSPTPTPSPTGTPAQTTNTVAPSPAPTP